MNRSLETEEMKRALSIRHVRATQNIFLIGTYTGKILEMKQRVLQFPPLECQIFLS